MSLGPTKSPVVLIRAHLSIVRAAIIKKYKPEPKPGGIEIAKRVWSDSLFFQRETSSSLGFLKTPDKAQITVDFSIGKRASAKL